MAKKELIEYVRERREQNADKEDITKELVEVGWGEKDIRETFRLLDRAFAEKKKIPLEEVLSWTIAILVLMTIVGASVAYSIFFKGSDERVIKGLNSVRFQAELLYDLNGNYNAVCGSNGVPQDENIKKTIRSVERFNGKGSVVCGRTSFGDTGAYAISSPLVSDNTIYYCVDSSGNVRTARIPVRETNTTCLPSIDKPESSARE